jgi:hypothetical protein
LQILTQLMHLGARLSVFRAHLFDQLPELMHLIL